MGLEQGLEIAIDGQIYEVKPHVKDDIYRLLRPYLKSARNAVTRNDLQKVAPAIFDRVVFAEKEAPVHIDPAILGKEPTKKMVEADYPGRVIPVPPGQDVATFGKGGAGAPPMNPTVIPRTGVDTLGPDTEPVRTEPDPGAESGDGQGAGDLGEGKNTDSSEEPG